MNSSKSTQIILFIYGLLVIVFLYLPLISVGFASVSKARYLTFPIKRYSTKWYMKAMESETVYAIVTTSLKVAVIVTDLVGLTDADTTQTFAILDGVLPQVQITSPVQGISVPEFHIVDVAWDATDNIGLDSIFIYYSNNPDTMDFELRGSTYAGTDELSIMISAGVTDRASVQIRATDIFGLVCTHYLQN